MKTISDKCSRVIVALDYRDEASVWALLDRLSPDDCRLKVGKALFTACGPTLVRKIVSRGFDVFLDLKFHDIPNTVADALQAAHDLGVWMVNVHASGGACMLEAARAALSAKDAPLLIAVTVLTSMEQAELSQIGVTVNIQQQILLLAKLALNAGLDGVVCSAQEAAMLRKKTTPDFCLVTPGIRPLDNDPDDQRRIMTPTEATRAGSDFLVIGRPITQAADPCAALRAINADLAAQHGLYT